MSESGPQSSREYARIALVVACLLATVLAGILIPAVTGGGLADSPAESLVPGDALSSDGGGGGENPASPGGDAGRGGSGSGGGSGLGALNPGDSTDVGGDVNVEQSAYRSQDTNVHLTVRSPRRAYWRTGSYDSYTGSGWEQTGERRPYTGPIAGEGMEGPRVEYRVTLNRSASAVPTVWRPRTVEGLSGLAVTDGRALRTDQLLGPGTTYTGVSIRPARDPAVLRSTGKNYPAAIERRYARIDPMISGRVERLTDDITAGADDPYAEARAIEAWLESNKAYSLNTSRTSNNVAESFIFEMEKGYCEYFATSMVVMLRSQDIPARYVVGYSTGQQVGENTYRVRGMNAHAWVEVYFEDVGWVKFDPTPGNARLRQERQSMQQAEPDENYSPRERGSPGEEFSAGNDEGTNTPTPTGGTPTPPGGTGEGGSETGGRTASGYDVSLNRSAVPGAAVTVTVTRNGEPAPDRTVLFNGEAVGTTDAEGTVTARVPYAETLRIAIEDGTTAALAPPAALPGNGRDRFYAVPRIGAAPGEVTVPVETNATVTVTGERVAGGTVTVTATVDDVPVRDATVLVAGDPVGTTDGEGRADVALPETPGTVTIAVERDPISGETTVSVADLRVAVRPNAPLALPLTGATVQVSAGGRPVSGAPVRVDGTRVAATDFNGTATVRLPLASSATVTVTARGLTREATVSGLFVNLGLVVVVLGLAVGGLLYGASRRGYGPRRVLAALRRLPGLVVQRGQWVLVTLARRGDELLGRALARARLTVAALRNLLAGRVTLAELKARLLAWLRERRRRLGSEGAGSAAGPNGGAGGEADDPRITIREAWARFLNQVSVRRRHTKTPGEIARHAVERDGLPAEPVAVVRDAFREVEYGSRPATERLDRVDEAMAAIEQSGGGGNGSGETRPDGGQERRAGTDREDAEDAE